GDRKSAKASAARALELDPKSQFALSTSADIALAENDSSAADGFVKRLEAFASGSESFTALRARVLASQWKSDDAIALLNSVANPGRTIVELKNSLAASTSTNAADLEKQ